MTQRSMKQIYDMLMPSENANSRTKVSIGIHWIPLDPLESMIATVGNIGIGNIFGDSPTWNWALLCIERY